MHNSDGEVGLMGTVSAGGNVKLNMEERGRRSWLVGLRIRSFQFLGTRGGYLITNSTSRSPLHGASRQCVFCEPGRTSAECLAEGHILSRRAGRSDGRLTFLRLRSRQPVARLIVGSTSGVLVSPGVLQELSFRVRPIPDDLRR